MSEIDYALETRSRRSIWLWAALAIVAASAWAWYALGARIMGPAKPVFQGSYVPAKVITMDITIRQAGELQSVDNVDIMCPVQGQNTIQTIVPEGTFVKKDDVIATLDSTTHRQNLDSAETELARADADVKWAIEQKRLQELKNVADLEAANSELALAVIAMKEYEDGTYPQSVREAKRALQMAELSLRRKEEDLAASLKLVEREFSTKAEVQKAELEVITARNAFEKAESELHVLTEYKHAKEGSEKKDKVTQAEKKLIRVDNENAANLAQKASDLSTKQRLLEQRKSLRDRLQTMFDKCTIKAQTDGMVLYASSVNTGYYRETPIQPGAKVYSEQLIVRLPDVSKMKAVVKIPESRAAKLRMMGDKTIYGEVAIVGVPKPIGAKMTRIGILPDNADRYINPDAKDYPVDISLDETPSGLKPGASAQVTIFMDKLDNVLTVPLGAIYSVGDEHWVFTRDDQFPRPVPVKVGEANETMIQILNGLNAEQEVLMLAAGQGRELLDRAGVKVKDPTPKPTGPSSRPGTPAVPEAAPAAPIVMPVRPIG